MNKNELKYLINSLLANHINNSNDDAIILNVFVLKTLLDFNYISYSVFDEYTAIVERNDFTELKGLMSDIADDLKIKLM